MILEDMSPGLIREEYFDGKRRLERKVGIIGRKARKKLGNAPGRHVRITWTDPRKNTWRVWIISGKKGTRYIPFLEYNDHKGHLRVILHNTKSDSLQIYTGHFFSRFRERAGVELTEGDVTDRIFLFLGLNTFNEIILSSGNILQVEFPTGVGLGYSYGDNVHLIKTFITHEMLRGDQITVSNQIQEALNKAD